MRFRVAIGVLLVFTFLGRTRAALADEPGPASVHLSVLVSREHPFDRQQARATYAGRDSLVYGYVVVEDLEGVQVPLADLKFALEVRCTPGVTIGPVEAEGGWRDSNSARPPGSSPDDDCEPSCLMASFPIRLEDASGSQARIQIIPAQDGSTCYPALRRRDGHYATLQYTVGASINMGLPATTVYPVWQLRPGLGGTPSTTPAVQRWLRDQAWTDVPVPTFADSAEKVIYRISPEGATRPTHRFEGQSLVRIWGHRPEYEGITFLRSQLPEASRAAVRVDTRTGLVDSLPLADGMLPGPGDRGSLLLSSGSRGGGPAQLVRRDGRRLDLPVSAKNAVLTPNALYVIGWPVESEHRGWDSNITIGAVTFYEMDFDGRIILQRSAGMVGCSESDRFASDGSVVAIVGEGRLGGGWRKLIRYSPMGDFVAVTVPSDGSSQILDRLDDAILLLDGSRRRLEIRDFATLASRRTIWAESPGPPGSRAMVLDGYLLADNRVCALTTSTQSNEPPRAVVYDSSGAARWSLADYPSECPAGDPSHFRAYRYRSVKCRGQVLMMGDLDAGVSLYSLP
jgi:hypothetical protein